MNLKPYFGMIAFFAGALPAQSRIADEPRISTSAQHLFATSATHRVNATRKWQS